MSRGSASGGSPADWVLAHLASTGPTGDEATLDEAMRGVFASLALETELASGRGMFAGLIVARDDYVETVARLRARLADDWRAWEALVEKRFGADARFRVSVLRGLASPPFEWILDRLEEEWMERVVSAPELGLALELTTHPFALCGRYPIRFTAAVQASKTLELTTRGEVDELCARLRSVAARRSLTNRGLAITSGANAGELEAAWEFLKQVVGALRGDGVTLVLGTTMGVPRSVSLSVSADRLDWFPIAFETPYFPPESTGEVGAFATKVAAELGVALETKRWDDR